MSEYNNIKIGIAQAKVEITALETNTAKLNSNNDFGGFLLTNAKTNQFWGSYVNKGNNSASLINGNAGKRIACAIIGVKSVC